MKRTAIYIILLAAAVAVAGAGPAFAQTSKPWRHGLIEPKSDAGILLMAAQRGFFKQVGLDVDIVKVKDDQVLLKATIAGDLDSFEGGPSGAMMAAARGADIKVIGCTWLIVPHGIFVHDDVTSMDQLKGKTIAISSPGAFPDIFAKGALAHFNMPPDSVKFASLGGDLDRYKALVANIVEAAVVSGEYVPIAKPEHIKMLVTAQEAVPQLPRMCLHATGANLAARPDDAAKFLAGEMLGLRYAMTHKDEAMKVAQEAADIKPDDPRPSFIYDQAQRQNAIGIDVPIPKDKLDWLNGTLVAFGSLPKPMDVSKLIDDRPRQAALKLVAQMH